MPPHTRMRPIECTIEDAAAHPDHLAQLQEWFVSEWRQIDPMLQAQIPSPRIALGSNNQPLGGLSFTKAASPLNGKPSVWINALYVLPEFRRAGLATALIKQAAMAAETMNIPELFVHTHVPRLYQKLNWCIVQVKNDHCVMHQHLSS